MRSSVLKLKTALISAAVAGAVSVPVAATVLPAAAAPALKPGSAVTKLSGYAKVSNGVVHYKSLAAVHAGIQITPKRAGRVTVSLQHRSGSTWVTDQTATFATTAAGTAWAGLRQGNRRMTYRYVVNATADGKAAASPKVTTASFMVD